MGLFSKHKDEKAGNKMPDSSGGHLPAPPVPDAAPAPSQEVGPSGTLSAPPVPGGSLEDIKSAVSEGDVQTSQNSNDFSSDSNNSISKTQDFSEDPTSLLDSDDSLFDFSDIDVPEPNSDMDGSTNLLDKSSNDDYFRTNKLSEGAVDTNIDHEDSLNFISRRRLSKPSNETYFVTTSQFKALLEVVESVKLRVKESSERHLRLLDIKSEEDLEYENLRKDFQFIEDKLYEVDSIIFEK